MKGILRSTEGYGLLKSRVASWVCLLGVATACSSTPGSDAQTPDIAVRVGNETVLEGIDMSSVEHKASPERDLAIYSEPFSSWTYLPASPWDIDEPLTDEMDLRDLLHFHMYELCSWIEEELRDLGDPISCAGETPSLRSLSDWSNCLRSLRCLGVSAPTSETPGAVLDPRACVTTVGEIRSYVAQIRDDPCVAFDPPACLPDLYPECESSPWQSCLSCGSGVASEARVADYSPEERHAICEWRVALMGGEGFTPTGCSAQAFSSGELLLNFVDAQVGTVEDCVADLADAVKDCPLSTEELENCTMAQMMSRPPCARLANLADCTVALDAVSCGSLFRVGDCIPLVHCIEGLEFESLLASPEGVRHSELSNAERYCLNNPAKCQIGLDLSRDFSDLSDAELQTLCTWRVDSLGGEGSGEVECLPPIGHHPEAVVGSVEDCVADLLDTFCLCSVSVLDIVACWGVSRNDDPCHTLFGFGSCLDGFEMSPCHLLLAYPTCLPILDCVEL